VKIILKNPAFGCLRRNGGDIICKLDDFGKPFSPEKYLKIKRKGFEHVCHRS
jgi:hypothetical protein